MTAASYVLMICSLITGATMITVGLSATAYSRYGREALIAGGGTVMTLGLATALRLAGMTTVEVNRWLISASMMVFLLGAAQALLLAWLDAREGARR